MSLLPTTHESKPGAPTPPFPRVLCAVDGSRHADAAVEQAIALCGADAELTLLAVTDVRGAGAARMASLGPARAEEALARAVRTGRAAGLVPHSLLVHAADVRAAILGEAARHDLLVLGTHGHHRGAAYLLGSSTVAAVHRSPVPVLVARANAAFPREILLATDGSSEMAPTVAVTAAVARRHGARVALVHVDHGGQSTRHELAAETVTILEATGTEPVVIELSGSTADRIAETARDLGSTLIVTGSGHRAGWHVFAGLGARVATVAPCSVLVVR